MKKLIAITPEMETRTQKFGGQPRQLLDIQDRDEINLEHNADEGEEGVADLLDVQTEDDISSDNSTGKSQNIDHQWTSDD